MSFSSVSTASTSLDIDCDVSRAVSTRTRQQMQELFLKNHEDKGPPDITIRTSDGGEWHVHREVLSGCPFLDKAANGLFKEGTSGVIELPNDPPSAVMILLEHLCCGWTKMRHPDLTNQREQAMSFFYLEVFNISITYDMPQLRKQARACFEPTMVGLAHKGFIDVIPRAVTVAWQNPLEDEDAMKQLLIDVSADRVELLLRHTEFLEVMLAFRDYRMGVFEAKQNEATLTHLHMWELQNYRKVVRMRTTEMKCPNRRCQVMLCFPYWPVTHHVYCIGCRKTTDAALWSIRRSSAVLTGGDVKMLDD
ncbi:uncharacterized protein BKA78DRAFT_298909 [Phyllosticta capitalensis]|uniref:uncharacterized protein n=1 Tax=Phyllosticta capitalensis TaxID=121624 RepID=UPI00312EE985